MKDGSQTRKGADIQRVDFLKPKCKLKVSCWNLRTLYKAGKLAQLLREMENSNIDLLGVSEARWTGAGNFRTHNIALGKAGQSTYGERSHYYQQEA